MTPPLVVPYRPHEYAAEAELRVWQQLRAVGVNPNWTRPSLPTNPKEAQR
jgi:hypothetical protein